MYVCETVDEDDTAGFYNTTVVEWFDSMKRFDWFRHANEKNCISRLPSNILFCGCIMYIVSFALLKKYWKGVELLGGWNTQKQILSIA